WRGDHIRYNFVTKEAEADKFRTGLPPFFVEGEHVEGQQTNEVYSATNAFVTSDDVANPGYRVRLGELKATPGRSVEGRNAILYLGNVPVFYFPYYHRRLDRHPNNFEFTPGYRSRYGPYLLSTYNWFWSDHLDGSIHLDGYERRGIGLGPDLHYELGQFGD